MIDEIIGEVITIAVLGFSIYKAFTASIQQHKTTQGKIDGVISTAQKQESAIEQLSKDIEQLKGQIK